MHRTDTKGSGAKVSPNPQDGLQGSCKLQDRGPRMMSSLSSSLGLGMGTQFATIEVLDLLFGPLEISYDQIVSANFRSITDMVKNPFPRVKILETHKTKQQITKIPFPN